MGRLPLFLALAAGVVAQACGEYQASGQFGRMILCCFIAAALWVAAEVFFYRLTRPTEERKER